MRNSSANYAAAADPALPLDPLQRYRACLLGLAAGDALGAAAEGAERGTFKPITDMKGGGPHRLKAGQWTDDTSMALSLADSLIDQRGFDPIDQLLRYCKWWRTGHLSSRDQSFSIGTTVRAALEAFERKRKPYCGPTEPETAGNGALMRLAPVPLYYAADPSEAIARAGESSRTTHGAPQSVDACRYFAGLLIGAVQGRPKEELLSADFSPAAEGWAQQPLDPAIAAVAGGSFKIKPAEELKATGYVADTLEAALWAFHTTSDFRSGALAAVNLGGDADTTGAVYGQLAGAYYGERAIPILWRHKLAHRYLIEAYATRLFELA